MNAANTNELHDFHRFVGEKLSNGGATLSPEEIVDEWRALHPDPQELDDDIAAIQEAIDDLEAGDTGIPLEEFDRQFRLRHNLPERT